MKLFLAGLLSSRGFLQIEKCKYALESFYYLRSGREEEAFANYHRHWAEFLLDSGAFSFMTGSAHVDWIDYTKRYADFINRHNVQLFFELDIDSIVGLTKVEQLRHLLEKETGKRCIPVWHIGRGQQYFVDMCKAYEYVALGGIAAKELSVAKVLEFDAQLNALAKNHGSKIHALGMTSGSLGRSHFFSVDSTSWMAGARYGLLQVFDGKRIIAKKREENMRAKDYKQITAHNYEQWLLYQQAVDHG